MGNTDSVPTTYSADDPSKVQMNEWLQTYKHNPYAHTDRIPWGNKGSHLSIGVKVIQDMNNNQLYVKTPQGQKIYITKDGKQLPNASQLITQGANYGLGPLVEIVGPPNAPEMYMWSGDQFMKGDKYQAVKINSLSDVQYAMTRKTDNTYDDKAHSGQYGEASISGPFQNRPRDFWTDAAAAERTVADIALQLIVPLTSDLIGTVIPGFAMIAQVSGLNNALTDAINTAQANHLKAIQYKSAANFDTSLANVITDPRLTQYYQNAQHAYTQVAHQTQTHDPSLLAMPNMTPEQRMLKSRVLETKTGNMQADQNATALESMMAQVKIKYPNLDWNYYDAMQSGLAMASTSEQKLNILQHFSTKLVDDVSSVQDKKAMAEATEQTSTLEANISELKIKYPNLDWDYYDTMQSGLAMAGTGEQKLNILQSFAGKLATDVQAAQDSQPKKTVSTTPKGGKTTTPPTAQPQKRFWTTPKGAKTTTPPDAQPQKRFWTTPDGGKTQNPPPKGSGFGPLSWNPLVINGTYTHAHQQVVIRG